MWPFQQSSANDKPRQHPHERSRQAGGAGNVADAGATKWERFICKDSTSGTFVVKNCLQPGGGNWQIARAHRFEEDENTSAVSLLFASGERPRAAAVRALAESSGRFSVSLDTSVDGGREEGWLELLANGLTFDVTGLAPQTAIEGPPIAHSFGLKPGLEIDSLQAVTIAPGPHLSAGGAMFPVVRTLAMIAAFLAELDGVDAVAWHPARTVSDAAYFRRSVMGWIEGGAFPGLGLTALVPTGDGGLVSEGLALFTGQELRLSPAVVPDRAEGAKIALRLLNWLVENGRITESFVFTGPSGETLRLEPVENFGIVQVWRGSH